MATREELFTALRNAHNAGDVQAAQRIAKMIQAQAAAGATAPQADAAAPAAPSESGGVFNAIWENIVGSGEADTFGEKLGQKIRGLTAATARGMAEAPALPVNVMQLGAAGVEKMLGMEQPSAFSQKLAGLPDTREMLYSLPIIGEEARYVAPDRSGQWISTIGEAVGAGGLLAGPKALLASGVSGAGSEAGGQLSQALLPDNQGAEIASRILGGIFAPTIAGRIVSPAGAPSAAQTRNAQTLREAGLPMTAGEATGSRGLRTLEGATSMSETALDDFNAFVMKSLGSTSRTADPDSLLAVKNSLRAEFDDITKNLRIDPTLKPIVSELDDIAEAYARTAPAGELRGLIGHISKMFDDALNGGQQISQREIMSWRSQLSEMTKSGNSETVTAAVKALNQIDELIKESLIAAGRSGDIARLEAVRPAWRNFLAVENAAARGTTANDLITPASLRNAIAAQGSTQLLYGQRGNLGAVAKAASDIYRQVPAVLPAGLRRFAGAAPAALAAIGAYVAGPYGAAIGGALPTASKMALNLTPVQRALQMQNPAAYRAMQTLTPAQRALIGVSGANVQ